MMRPLLFPNSSVAMEESPYVPRGIALIGMREILAKHSKNYQNTF